MSGKVTNAAKSCADSLAVGATLFCKAPYASAAETSQDGEQAVADAVANGSGSWFLDADLSKVEVGWASDGAGHLYCVFLKN